ncbi:cytochrome C [Duganella qianjiadongensis]|uniref:Cytochrome C n=1 Tax=Duganella qianjiadongensis TaxID=2692176 RepID=A0ABW9VHH5_9BURK|nr:cytochrome C [Duganella qianjiadongensis]MYM38110.1 cytochrome C [Duganella qianjiadongensis]
MRPLPSQPSAPLAAGLLSAALLTACGGGSTDIATSSSGTRLAQGAPVQGAAATNTANNATTSAATSLLALAANPLQPVGNEAGSALTISSRGSIDSSNPFFQPMGNGRSCASCHQPDNGWSIGPDKLAARFDSSAGLDPVFRSVDGAVSPQAPTATLEQKRLAYALLLGKGLIRVGLALPSAAEFTLSRVDDPYHYASASELSLFRRPLPTTNLTFLSSVMWDSRETASANTGANCVRNTRPALCFASITSSLLHQANDAVRGHAEAAQDLSAAQQRAIVDFEQTLYTAQINSSTAGSLTAAGALGGPLALSQTAYYFGINDIDAGDYQTGAPFKRDVITLFGAWRNLDRPPAPAPAQRGRPPAPPSATDVARAAIARGEQIFNNKGFNISGVAGFNDELRRPLARGSCTSCHDAPGIGSQSVARMFNTGVSAASRRSADLPLYTLRNSTTGETISVSDPGAAMLSGKWKDIGRFKVPSLRGLESRSPYFHDGSAASIEQLVQFYDTRFNIGYTVQEAADLAAFLKAL